MGNTIPGFKQGSYRVAMIMAIDNFALTYAFVYVQIRIQGKHGHNIDP
jgi:hypothetical protein